MPKLFSYVLLGVILLQIGLKLFIEVDFLVYQTDIIEKLCENKDKPELQCNGKCYLMKEIKKLDENLTSDSNENVPNSLPYIKSLEFFEPLEFLVAHPTNWKLDHLTYSTFVSHYSFLYSSTIDHPPAFS